MPAAVPIHTFREESSNNVFTSFDGRPSAAEYRRHPLDDITLAPFGVANQTAPSAVSTTAATVLEASPSAVVKVVNLPSLRRLTPRLSVPAHTAPSRPR